MSLPRPSKSFALASCRRRSASAPEFLQRQMIQPQGLGLIDALAVPDFLQQLVQ